LHIRSFFKLVEIQTKLASFFPFLLGTLYALYRFGEAKPVNLIIMFLSMLMFDMFTTALNNYFDYKRAIRKYGFGYEHHNAIVKDKLKESTVLVTLGVLLSVAVVSGIALVWNTNWIVLLVGMLSFGVGICYSFGPVPISRTPLGELFSGFFMGFVIVFLSVYIHVFDRNFITVAWKSFELTFQVQLLELLGILLISVPTMCGIANIMLANNICDIEEDMENRRYTLPVFIGREKALGLFKWLYGLAYLAIGVSVMLRFLPVLCLVSLVTLIPVSNNIREFNKMQTKKETFALSVKNFLVSSAALVLLLAASTAVSAFFSL
jgi:1,4-dihydroxy-2-naphthoate polyprenyltransferase